MTLRLLRGESLDAVSRETGVPAARLSAWRESFLDTGKEGLKSRRGDAAQQAQEAQTKRLQAKVGELTMDNELLREKIRRLEGGHPLAPGRSKR